MGLCPNCRDKAETKKIDSIKSYGSQGSGGGICDRCGNPY